MQELVEKLIKNYGLSPEETYGVLNSIKDYIKKKIPMMGGAIDNFFPAEATSAQGTDTDIAQAVAGSVAPSATEGHNNPIQGPPGKEATASGS